MSSEPAATLRHRTNAMPAPLGTGEAEDIRHAAEQMASKIPPHHTLTSLSITHVQFAQDDILSKLFAYVTLSPLAILCGYVAVIITSRDLKPAVMFAGQLANELVNLILKRLVKQARPTEYLGDGYGMPSSHSQFMAYFATYVVILMYRRSIASDPLIPHTVSAVVVLWSALVVYSRVHLYYHTWQQVVAGTICGFFFAIIYYNVVNGVLRSKGLFDWIVDHPLARHFHIRDTDSIHDVAKFDWEMWQQYRRTTAQAKNQ
ncbi:PAP2-domain-containing protein [Linnemannia elongata AG-77]|uniref:Dolichyldiphosphatase n=1 Tax=Linnemannia elongata AG-77 TaxID=1314771 RepID=A0A197K921_9FUNG|nr:PAP2-domain-containing protein [Linnemannia elongata AG-77]